MGLKILIAPDKFKGTLTAAQAACAIARGWHKARPEDQIELLPITDGGDGFGEVMRELLKGRQRRASALDAAHRRTCAPWWAVSRPRIAIIESARIIGLAMLPRGTFHPFDLDSQGLGQLLRAAADAGARQCLLGLGGSATNDGGFGLALALGWRFADSRGRPLRRWVQLTELATLTPPVDPPLGEMEVVAATDVGNPLLGPIGASRVYGPQKGLRSRDMPVAEAALGQLADRVRQQSGRNLARVPGAGAAGGLGFGLMAFAGARIERGFEVFARQADLDTRLGGVDLVVTGEGAVDASSLMGKGVGEVARRCRERGLPCLGLAGRLGDPVAANRWFTAVHAIVPGLADGEAAQREAARWLALLAQEAAGRLPPASVKHAGRRRKR